MLRQYIHKEGGWFSQYLKTRAKAKVTAGNMLTKAHETVADVYDRPSKKKNCIKLALQFINPKIKLK